MSALLFSFTVENETNLIIMVGEGTFVIPRGSDVQGVFATLREAVEHADAIAPLLGVSMVSIIFK